MGGKNPGTPVALHDSAGHKAEISQTVSDKIDNLRQKGDNLGILGFSGFAGFLLKDRLACADGDQCHKSGQILQLKKNSLP